MCCQSVVRRSRPPSAIPRFPLASLAPTLDRWRDEAIDACVSDRLRHFVSAADQFRHRYFRDYLYSYASPARATKFQRFDDEHILATVQTTQACSVYHTGSGNVASQGAATHQVVTPVGITRSTQGPVTHQGGTSVGITRNASGATQGSAAASRWIPPS
jgi:hypothetical protein